jgi:hypothetical protein
MNIEICEMRFFIFPVASCISLTAKAPQKEGTQDKKRKQVKREQTFKGKKEAQGMTISSPFQD